MFRSCDLELYTALRQVGMLITQGQTVTLKDVKNFYNNLDEATKLKYKSKIIDSILGTPLAIMRAQAHVALEEGRRDDARRLRVQVESEVASKQWLQSVGFLSDVRLLLLSPLTISNLEENIDYIV
jgi:hypothetical protein